MFFLSEYLSGYQIYIGGNGGTDVTVGKLLTTVETEDEVIQLCGSTQLRGQPDTPILNLCGVSMYSNVFSKRIPKRVVLST
jgi:hypothetical protein